MRFFRFFSGLVPTLMISNTVAGVGVRANSQAEIVAKIKACNQSIVSFMEPIKQWWKNSKAEYKTALKKFLTLDISNGQGTDHLLKVEKRGELNEKLKNWLLSKKNLLEKKFFLQKLGN